MPRVWACRVRVWAQGKYLRSKYLPGVGVGVFACARGARLCVAAVARARGREARVVGPLACGSLVS